MSKIHPQSFESWRRVQLRKEWPGGRIHWKKLWRAVDKYVPGHIKSNYSAEYCINVVLNKHIKNNFMFHNNDYYYFKTEEDLNLIRLVYDI